VERAELGITISQWHAPTMCSLSQQCTYIHSYTMACTHRALSSKGRLSGLCCCLRRPDPRLKLTQLLLQGVELRCDNVATSHVLK
jgi:hypothetical protein